MAGCPADGPQVHPAPAATLGKSAILHAVRQPRIRREDSELIGWSCGRRQSEIDAVGKDRQIRNSRDGIRQSEILLVRDDDALDALALSGEVGSNPPHVSRSLADHRVGRAPALQLDDHERVGVCVPSQEVQASHGRCQLVSEFAGLRFPEL